jgi:hypothetical protein
MFKKASSHLKGLATGFLNNAINNSLSGFSSNLSSALSGSQAKVASQLLKKSPLETRDPMDAINADPLSFSYVQYPIDLTNFETGHYMLFYSIANDFGSGSNIDFEAAKRVGQVIGVDDGNTLGIDNLRQLKSASGQTLSPVTTENSVLSSFPQNTRVTSAIALYMPPGIKVSYGMDYSTEDTGLAGTIANALGRATSANNTAEQVGAVVAGVKGAAVDYGKKLVGEITAGLEMGDPVKLASKAVGIAINPHEEQFFNKPNFRSFTYTFNFWPRSPEEVKKVDDIIFLFKYHAHPELDMNSETGGRYFRVPSEFEIHYAYLDRENEYLNKISKCVLKTVDVEYGPSEQFSTFEGLNDPKGAPPVTYQLSLTFEETQFLTKKQILAGY